MHRGDPCASGNADVVPGRNLSRLSRVATCGLAAGLAFFLMPLPAPSSRSGPAGAVLQLARQPYSSTGSGASASRKKPFDPDAPDKSWSRSTTSHIGGAQPPSTNYNPERIKHFWQHYKFDTREPKERPLEREK